jgi:hypothetical protein
MKETALLILHYSALLTCKFLAMFKVIQGHRPVFINVTDFSVACNNISYVIYYNEPQGPEEIIPACPGYLPCALDFSMLYIMSF